MRPLKSSKATGSGADLLG